MNLVLTRVAVFIALVGASVIAAPGDTKITQKNSANSAWIDRILAEGPAGYMLTTNGSGGGYTWVGPATSGPLPSQTNHSASLLSTDGSNASWKKEGTIVNGNWSGVTRFLPDISTDQIYNTATFDGFGFVTRTTTGRWRWYYSEGVSDSVGGSIKVKSSDTLATVVQAAPTTIVAFATNKSRSGVTGGVTLTGRIVLCYPDYNSGAGTTSAINVIYSDDEGATWSNEYQLNQQGQLFAVPYGAMQVQEDGTLSLTFYGSNGAFNTGTLWKSYMVRSTDNGATWTSYTTMVSDAVHQVSETSTVYVGAGRYIGLMRVNNGSVMRQIISTDFGATFTDQGDVTFTSGLSGADMATWLSLVKDANGLSYLVVYYRESGAMVALTGEVTALMSGVAGWAAATKKTVSTLGSRGYPAMFHPDSQGYGVGYVMKAVTANDADMVFVTNSALTYLTSTSGVASIAGTSGQIAVSGSTGSVTVSLPATITQATTFSQPLTVSAKTLAVGTTASAWSASFAAQQWGTGLAVWSGASGSNDSYVTANTYYDGSVYHALTIAPAQRIAMSGGLFSFGTAPLVTNVGDAQTFTDYLVISPTSVAVTNALEGTEQGSSPAPPAANGWRLYAKDNGAGKTVLYVRFASGAEQQIAIEP